MGFLLVSEFSAASCWSGTADFFGQIPTQSRSTEDNFGSACFQTQSDSKMLLQGTLSGMFLWNPGGIEILFVLKTDLPQELLQRKSQNCLFNLFFNFLFFIFGKTAWHLGGVWEFITTLKQCTLRISTILIPQLYFEEEWITDDTVSLKILFMAVF